MVGHLKKVRSLTLGTGLLRSKTTLLVGWPSFSQLNSTPSATLSITSKSLTLPSSIRRVVRGSQVRCQKHN